MTISHALISSALLSGVVFAASTLPLTLLGSQPITLEMGEKPLFSGRLEELSTPYLSFATALSLGVGAATFGLLGWQASARKLNRTEEQVAILKQKLQEKEALLEYLKFSETKLQSTGLDQFLEPEAVPYQPVSMFQAQALSSEERQSKPFTSVGLSHRVESPLAIDSHTGESVQSSTDTPYNLHDANQVQALLTHLKQVMHQIETLQVTQPQSAVHNRLMNRPGRAIS